MKNKRAKLIAKQTNPDESKHFRLKLAVGIIVACGFIYLAWHSYATQVSNINEADLPLIKAPHDPIKVRPDDPGGLKIDHKDKEIYDHISGKHTKKTEKLVKNQLKPASHDKIKKVISKNKKSRKANIAKNTHDTVNVKPVIIKMPKQPTRKVVKKIVKPKNYYLRIAALKSPDVKNKAWSILKAKYSALKPLSPKVSKVKRNNRLVYFLDAGPLRSKQHATKICQAITKAGGKCKLY